MLINYELLKPALLLSFDGLPHDLTPFAGAVRMAVRWCDGHYNPSFPFLIEQILPQLTAIRFHLGKFGAKLRPPISGVLKPVCVIDRLENRENWFDGHKNREILSAQALVKGTHHSLYATLLILLNM